MLVVGEDEIAVELVVGETKVEADAMALDDAICKKKYQDQSQLDTLRRDIQPKQNRRRGQVKGEYETHLSRSTRRTQDCRCRALNGNVSKEALVLITASFVGISRAVLITFVQGHLAAAGGFVVRAPALVALDDCPREGIFPAALVVAGAKGLVYAGSCADVSAFDTRKSVWRCKIFRTLAVTVASVVAGAVAELECLSCGNDERQADAGLEQEHLV